MLSNCPRIPLGGVSCISCIQLEEYYPFKVVLNFDTRWRHCHWPSGGYFDHLDPTNTPDQRAPVRATKMTISINRRPRLPGGRYAVAGLGLDSGCPLAASKSTRPTNTTSALCHLFSRFSREEENARTLLGGRLRSRMKWKCEKLILLKYERPSPWHFTTYSSEFNPNIRVSILPTENLVLGKNCV